MNYSIESLGGNCPVQAEGWIETPKGKHRFYFRARGTKVSMDVTEDPARGHPLDMVDDENVWTWRFQYGWTYEAGWITQEFARGCIDEAASVFLGKVKRELAAAQEGDQ